MSSSKKYKAFLFDLNGTMIDDMQFHIVAWHGILNQLGANISMERMKEECYGKNHELLERMFPGRYTWEEKDRMSFEKEEQYQEKFRPVMKLIDGLDHFLADTKTKGIKTAIGSAAIMFNVNFILDELHIRKYIDAVVSADDVKESKPNPETFLSCAAKLGTDPSACLVFEDAPKGVEAAANAGMDCLVLTTMHEPHEFQAYKNIIGFVRDYNDPIAQQLL